MKRNWFVIFYNIIALILIAFMIDNAIFLNYVLKDMLQNSSTPDYILHKEYDGLIGLNIVSSVFIFIIIFLYLILYFKKQLKTKWKVAINVLGVSIVILSLVTNCKNYIYYKNVLLGTSQEDWNIVYNFISPHYQFSIVNIILCCLLLLIFIILLSYYLYKNKSFIQSNLKQFRQSRKDKRRKHLQGKIDKLDKWK